MAALPSRPRSEFEGDLEGLGQVRFVVCPNLGHHMFAGEYFAAYPDAGFYAAPGLPEKRSDLPFNGVLGDAPEPGWAKDLEQVVFRGNRMVREVGCVLLGLIVEAFVPEGGPLVVGIDETLERPGNVPKRTWPYIGRISCP